MKPYGIFTVLIKLLRYYLRAKSKHQIHSPFVYSLITDCLSVQRAQAQQDIELLRRKLKRDHRTLSFVDYGQGGARTDKRISQIAKLSLKPRKYAQLIAKLAAYFKVHNALELGTSLGITTAYLSRNVSGKVLTFEGSEEVARIAKANWEALNCSNIVLYTGPFHEQLLLVKRPPLDLVFIDGHHQKQACLDYFEQLLPQCHDNSLIIFDDIHWSPAMEEAWELIKTHARVSTTLDLFFVGLVFLKPELSNEHIELRY